MNSYKSFLTERKFSTEKIKVFDLDETLIITDAKIKVKDEKTGEILNITPEEFNSFEIKKGMDLDFSDFHSIEILKAGKLIHDYLDILKSEYKRKTAISIVTARGDREMIFKWLKDHIGYHITRDLIFAVNDPIHNYSGSIADKKESAFKEILKMGFNDIEYFDDDLKNVKQIRRLLSKHKHVTYKINHVK